MASALIHGNPNQLSDLSSYFQSSRDYYGNRLSYSLPDYCRDCLGLSSKSAETASRVALNLGVAAGSLRGQSVSIDQNISYSSERGDKKRREEQKNDNAFMVGAIALVVLAGTLAYTWGNFSESRKALNEASETEKIFKKLGKKQENNNETFRGLKALFDENVKVTQTRYSNSRDWFALNVVALTTAASAVLGGQLSIRWLVSTSKIAGVFTLALTAFLLVARWNSKTSLSLEKQEELAKAVRTLAPPKG